MRNLLFKKLIETTTVILRPSGGIRDSDYRVANPVGRAAQRVGLRQLACYECSIESRPEHACFYLSGRGLSAGPIPRPEHSYRVCVTVNVHLSFHKDAPLENMQSHFKTKILYTFLISPMHATCLRPFSSLDFITLIVPEEDYNA